MNRAHRVLPALLIASLLVGVPAFAQEAAADKPASVVPVKKVNPAKPEHADWWMGRHEGFLKDKEEALKKGPVDLLFVGDSITDGWRRNPQHKVFLERWGKHNPLNLGIGGDRTQHVLWRLDNKEVDGLKPKAIVLMIGTNNLGNNESPEDTILGVKAVVASLRAKLPESKILLLAVFPRGEKPDNKFRPQIKQVNDAISKLGDDDKHVVFLDINAKFLAEDGTLTKEIMPDALHPEEKGYTIWADAIAEKVDELTK